MVLFGVCTKMMTTTQTTEEKQAELQRIIKNSDGSIKWLSIALPSRNFKVLRELLNKYHQQPHALFYYNGFPVVYREPSEDCDIETKHDWKRYKVLVKKRQRKS